MKLKLNHLKRTLKRNILPILCTIAALLAITVIFSSYGNKQNPQSSIVANEQSVEPEKSFPIPKFNRTGLTDQQKAEKIRQSFWRDWNIYKMNAWGYDYYNPITGEKINKIEAGYTLAEYLSTLEVMNVTYDRKKVLKFYKDANFVGDTVTSKFIPIILGSLLSTGDLTENEEFFDAAVNIWNMFKQPKKEEAYFYENLTISKGRIERSSSPNISTHTLGSYPVEFLALYTHTENPLLLTLGHQIYNVMYELADIPSVLSNCILGFTGGPNYDFKCGKTHSIQWDGESAYLPLMRTYIYTLSGFSGASRFLGTYHIFNQTFFIKDGEYLIPKNTLEDERGPIVDFRTAWLPGMLAYASLTMTDWPFLYDAERLMNTFIHIVESTDVPPLECLVGTDDGGAHEVTIIDDTFEYAPEYVESLFALYRVTGKPKYKKAAWSFFEKMEKAGETPFGHANIKNGEKQPTVNLKLYSATYKYLYLIFSGEYSIQEWAFTNHGHILRRWINVMHKLEKIAYDTIPEFFLDGNLFAN